MAGGLIKKAIGLVKKIPGGIGKVPEGIGSLGDNLGSPLISNLGTRLGRYNSYNKAIKDSVLDIFDGKGLSDTIPEDIARGIKNRRALKDIDGFKEFMADTSIDSTIKDKINTYNKNLNNYTDRLEINKGTLRSSKEALFNKKRDIVVDTASKVEDKAGKVKEAVGYTPEQIKEAQSDLIDMVTKKKITKEGYRIKGEENLLDEVEFRKWFVDNHEKEVYSAGVGSDEFEKLINDYIENNKDVVSFKETITNKPFTIKQLVGYNEDETAIFDEYVLSRNKDYDKDMLGSKKFNTYVVRNIGLVEDGKKTASKGDKEFISEKLFGKELLRAKDAGIVDEDSTNTILTALNVAQNISHTGAGAFSGLAELSGQIPSWAIYGGIGFGAMALLNSFNNRRDY